MNDTQPLPTLVKGYEPTSVFSYPQQQPGINADLVAEFTDYLDTTKATAKTYAKSLKVFFNWITENHITNPQRQDLIAFRSQLLEKDKATTTANYINALKQFFKWLDFEGIYPDITNHLKGAKVGHEHRKDPLTEEQARELLASIDISNIEGLRDYAIIYLCLSCGLRTIEVARSNIEELHTTSGLCGA
jgi:integrase/recombinase XerD